MNATISKAHDMPDTYLGLLRGINVGGKNILPMKDLAAMFVAAGCSDVRTFIQSGNVVFKASSGVAKKVPLLVADQIMTQFGYKTPVVIRTTEQLREAHLGNPFIEQGADEDQLHLLFLADLPKAPAVAGLDPERSPGDRYVVRGRDIYLCLTTGAAKTKLTNAYFDSKLATVSTGRNWRTVTKLLAMMQ
jgi:uncharacterized protein (DUF1697 family)